MNTGVASKNDQELQALCVKVKNLISEGNYEECMDTICQAMSRFPDAPQPHNLLGILCEQEGNHATAMRHFRAAYALDPGYQPAHDNLDTYGTFYARGRCVYGDETVHSKKPML